MKVMQINCVYNSGSTGKIVYDLHNELKANGIESVVCYGRGKKVKEENVYKTCGELYSKLNNLWSRITGIMYGGCLISTNKLFRIIKKEKPDIVHLHCLNGYFVNIYRLITFLKNNNYKTVLTLHAEFMYTANCGHALECDKWKTGCGKCPRLRSETKSWFIDGTAKSWKKMKRAFQGFDNLQVVSVSPWLMDRAKNSAILSDKKHSVILNGLDTSIFFYRDTEDLRKRYNLENCKIIFHATPDFNLNPNHIKGGYYVTELAKRMLNKPVKFLIAGNYDKSRKYPSNMIMLGKIDDQKTLASFYSMADITLLTSRKETFSMVVAESLCCGTPVAGFRAGAPEQIALNEYSEFVPFGDLDKLEKAVEFKLENFNNKKRITSEASRSYSDELLFTNYKKIYK